MDNSDICITTKEEFIEFIKDVRDSFNECPKDCDTIQKYIEWEMKEDGNHWYHGVSYALGFNSVDEFISWLNGDIDNEPTPLTKDDFIEFIEHLMNCPRFETIKTREEFINLNEDFWAGVAFTINTDSDVYDIIDWIGEKPHSKRDIEQDIKRYGNFL